MSVLSIQNLSASFYTHRGIIKAVQEVSFDVHSGETLAIVGESGSGKSVCQMSYLGLLPKPPLKIESGKAIFGSSQIDLLQQSEKTLQSIRGKDISVIFQEPMTALNPYLRVGTQVMEPLFIHQQCSKQDAWKQAQEMLKKVGIHDTERAMNAYPHEFSGGMRQRVMIAMALITRPKLLIADEPTTALDVTVQAQVLTLLKDLQKEFKMAMIFITHDLGVVAGIADRVAVMNRGRIVETGSVEDIFYRGKDPYTLGLIQATPKLVNSFTTTQKEEVNHSLTLKVEKLQVEYKTPSLKPFSKSINFKAVHDVGFEIASGEILGLVGESGCGKTSLGKAVIRLIEPTQGKVEIEKLDFLSLKGKTLRENRKKIQMIFQDPYASLDPRMTVSQSIAEPLQAHGNYSNTELQKITASVLESVGLTQEMGQRYPHEFSGGQRQRIAIGRALVLEPALLIADEPVSSLDVTIQAQILNLLKQTQARRKFSMLFISHNLAVVQQISDRVAVMYLGEIVEIGKKESLYTNPRHPYTQALLKAVPIPDPKQEKARLKETIQGEPPSRLKKIQGCAFRSRCPIAIERCQQESPKLTGTTQHQVACFKA